MLIDGIRWIAPIKEVTREPRQSGTTQAPTSVLTQMALSIIAQNALTSHHRTSYNSPSSHPFIKEWLAWVLNQVLIVCITLWDKYFPNNVPGNEVRLAGMPRVMASSVLSERAVQEEVMAAGFFWTS